MTTKGTFEEFLRNLNDTKSGPARQFRAALIDVGDTMEGCQAWFEQHGRGCPPTAADLVAMAALVMRRAELEYSDDYARGHADGFGAGLEEGRTRAEDEAARKAWPSST